MRRPEVMVAVGLANVEDVDGLEADEDSGVLVIWVLA